MVLARRIGLAVLILCLVTLTGVRADKEKEDEKKKDAPVVSPLPLLPPDAILVLFDSSAKALEMVAPATVEARPALECQSV